MDLAKSPDGDTSTDKHNYMITLVVLTLATMLIAAFMVGYLNRPRIHMLVSTLIEPYANKVAQGATAVFGRCKELFQKKQPAKTDQDTPDGNLPV